MTKMCKINAKQDDMKRKKNIFKNYKMTNQGKELENHGCQRGKRMWVPEVSLYDYMVQETELVTCSLFGLFFHCDCTEMEGQDNVLNFPIC